MTRKVEKEMKPVLSMLGPRPGSEAVEAAKQAVVLIDRRLAVESAAHDLPVSRFPLFLGTMSVFLKFAGRYEGGDSREMYT